MKSLRNLLFPLLRSSNLPNKSKFSKSLFKKMKGKRVQELVKRISAEKDHGALKEIVSLVDDKIDVKDSLYFFLHVMKNDDENLPIRKLYKSMCDIATSLLMNFKVLDEDLFMELIYGVKCLVEYLRSITDTGLSIKIYVAMIYVIDEIKEYESYLLVAVYRVFEKVLENLMTASMVMETTFVLESNMKFVSLVVKFNRDVVCSYSWDVAKSYFGTLCRSVKYFQDKSTCVFEWAEGNLISLFKCQGGYMLDVLKKEFMINAFCELVMIEDEKGIGVAIKVLGKFYNAVEEYRKKMIRTFFKKRGVEIEKVFEYEKKIAKENGQKAKINSFLLVNLIRQGTVLPCKYINSKVKTDMVVVCHEY